MLDAKESLRIEHRKEIEKKQEYKLLGYGKKRKGLKLFAFNFETDEVYEVQLVKKKELHITSKQEVLSTYKAFVNPKHAHLYALNKKNAERKFKKNFVNPKNKE